MSYQQCTRFRTTLWTSVANISGTDQAINKRKLRYEARYLPRSMKTIW